MSERRRDGFAPKKSLGQHFIRDEALLERLAELSGASEDDVVLEIGAGTGGLTAALAKRAKAVIAVEIDRELEPVLLELSRNHHNIHIYISDALKMDWPALTGMYHETPARFVSNLPYYISTPLLMKALTHVPPFASLACMAQREVACKMTALPGSGGYGTLAILTQALYIPKIALEAPASSFYPPPNVESVFVVCVLQAQPLIRPNEYARFNRLLAAAFGMRRKTLRNNLRAAFHMDAHEVEEWLERAGVDPCARAEAVSPEEFANILSLDPTPPPDTGGTTHSTSRDAR